MTKVYSRVSTRSGGRPGVMGPMLVIAALVIGIPLERADAADHASGAATAGAAPVQLAERRQLTGDQIHERIVDRLLEYKRLWKNSRGGVTKITNWVVNRLDGSFLYKCEYYNEGAAAWALCTGVSPERKFKGWLNGVWRIEGDLFCSTPGPSEWREKNCYRYFDDSGRLFVEKAYGDRPTAFPGFVDVLPAGNIRCVGKLREAEC